MTFDLERMMRIVLRDVCSATGKRRFDTSKAAKAFRAKNRTRHPVGERSIRSYNCGLCGDWHNTSMPLDTYEQTQPTQRNEHT